MFMNESNKPLFESMTAAERYVEDVRGHYRDGHAEYKGRRNEEQQIIAELTSDESRLIVDGVASSILSLRWGIQTEATLPANYETEVTRAGFTWEDYRSEFERLMVGFGIITNRLNREEYDVKSYADMSDPDRMKVASVMFADFIKHNALRFGVDTSGILKTNKITKHTDDGEVERITVKIDIDKATSDKAIGNNMAVRKFHSLDAQHPAGKISPKTYKKLRTKYPEMKKDNFDYVVSVYTDVEKELANRE